MAKLLCLQTQKFVEKRPNFFRECGAFEKYTNIDVKIIFHTFYSFFQGRQKTQI